MEWQLILEALAKAANDFLIAGLGVVFPYVIFRDRE
jgi:hypothetical protein